MVGGAGNAAMSARPGCVVDAYRCKAFPGLCNRRVSAPYRRGNGAPAAVHRT
jgi:hypothetical protein